MAIAVIAFQIYFVFNMHPPVGFDVIALYNAINGKPYNFYYSFYPNNVSVFMYMNFWSQLFGSTSWLFLDLDTLVWVDLSAILNILALYFINKKLVVPGIYMHVLWLGLFPMIIVPYTDCWVLPFVSLYLLMWAILQNRPSYKIWSKILLAIIMALGVVGAYFIKPWAIIPFIAIVIIELLACLKGNFNISKVIVTVSFVLMGFVGYTVVNYHVQNQKYIAVDKDKGVTPFYYISLGMSEYSKYNGVDALEMANSKDTKNLNEISKRKIKERLEARGSLGYIKFLLFKQNLNTSDGTFGWLKEGGFINEVMPNKSGFAQ